MNDVAISNPFAGQVVHPTTTTNTDQQRAIAEVQAAMVVARANPRDPVAAMDRILNACTRPTLAEQAVYSYARGGSEITGPSIRLAEALAQNWGNMQFGIRELDQHAGASTVQAFAWDVETNTRREVVFQVEHKRSTRKGSYRLEDPRDIYELVANNGARRLRACILSVIPGDVTEAAVKQCETTLATTADTSVAAVQKLVAAFEPFGVTKAMIEQRIQRRLDAIVPAQIVMLRKVYASLKDGMATVADHFEVEEASTAPAQSKTESVKDQIRKRQAAASSKPAAKSEEAFDTAAAPTVKHGPAPHTNPETGEVLPDYTTKLSEIRKCQNIEALDLVGDTIRDFPEGVERTKLDAAYAEKRAEFEGKDN